MRNLIDKLSLSKGTEIEDCRNQLALVINNLNATAGQCSGEIQVYLLELSSLFDAVLKYVENLLEQRKYLD
jgi:hypothetical protein